MDIESLRDYCLAKKGSSEDLPFDDVTLVFKVLDKAFALTSLKGDDLRVNLKCDPEYAIELREEHADIIPGFHMNKKHWNSVYFERELDDRFLMSLIDHSYDLVVGKMTKAQKLVLENL